MSRGSDIDFAKFALIFGFAKKDDICTSIREVALLQELGINKRLPHIMYERKYLSADEVQSIFWGLYNSRRIRRFPTRIVYEFTEEDDQNFFEQASIPINDLMDNIREQKTKIKSRGDSFPQEFLIYAQDLQNKLAKKGFHRSLLSILNTKGYLTTPYKKLVPNIEEKRIILSAPQLLKNANFRYNCEYLLFAALAKKKFKLKTDDAQHAFEVWKNATEKYPKIEFKYSEILYFVGYAKRSEAHAVGLALEYVTNIDQNPRAKFVDTRAQLFSAQNPEYKEKYPDDFNIADELRNMGLSKLDGANLLLYKGLIDYDSLPQDQSTASLDLTMFSGGDRNQQKLLSINSYNDTERRKKIFRSLVPYSLTELGHEFENMYLQERLAVRKNPTDEADQIVQEWAQTQMLSLHDETYHTEVVPLQSSKDIKLATKKTTPAKMRKITKNINDTEYISLPQQEQTSPPQRAQTEYFELQQHTRELKILSEKIEQNISEVRSTKLLMWSLFCLYAGAAIVFGCLQDIFGPIKELPFYSGMSTFIMCFPAILFANYCGRLADRGQTHKLILWGFLIHVICIPVLPFFDNIYVHLFIKFIQAIGLVAVSVGIEFCVTRWYGIGERGKMLGITAMIAATGTTFGFILPAIFKDDSWKAIIDLGDLTSPFLASTIWTIITLITIPFAYKIRLGVVNTEDIDDEMPKEKIAVSQAPLLASSIYGIIQMAIFVVFLPTFEQKIKNPPEFLSKESLALVIEIGVLISSYIFGRLSDRTGPLRILKALTFVAVLCCIFIPYTFLLQYVLLAFFVFGLVEGGIHPLGFAWLLEVVDDEQYFGAATGAYTLYNSAGAMFGCLFCGILFSYVEISTFFFVLTIVFILYLYLILISQNTNKINKPSKMRGMLKLLEPAEAEL